MVVDVRGIYVMCKVYVRCRPLLFANDSRPNGNTFVVRKNTTENNDAAANLKIGDVVTFKCLHFFNSGVPKSPVLVRKREDVKWEEIVK